jgi:hypothetical protein
MQYHLKMSFNDQIFETDTDDLADAIMSFKPKSLKTRIIITVTKEGKSCMRQLFVFKGKMLFRSKLFLNIFIDMLIFKDNALDNS